MRRLASATLIATAVFLCTGFVTSADPLLTEPTEAVSTREGWYRVPDAPKAAFVSVTRHAVTDPFYTILAVDDDDDSLLFEWRAARIPGTSYSVVQQTRSTLYGDAPSPVYFLMKSGGSRLEAILVLCEGIHPKIVQYYQAGGEFARTSSACRLTSRKALFDVFKDFAVRMSDEARRSLGPAMTFVPVDRSVVVAAHPNAFRPQSDRSENGLSAGDRAKFEYQFKAERRQEWQRCKQARQDALFAISCD